MESKTGQFVEAKQVVHNLPTSTSNLILDRVENGIQLVCSDPQNRLWNGTVMIKSCNGPVTNVDGVTYWTKGKQTVDIVGTSVKLDGVHVTATLAKALMDVGCKTVLFAKCI